MGAVLLLSAASSQAAYPVAKDGRILFSASSTVWVANPAGGGAVPLFPGEPTEAAGSFSPDGKRIVFTRNVGPTSSHIMVANADGTGVRDLTPSSTEVNTTPTFSPDGKQIAFASDTIVGPTTLTTIAVMNADGSGVRDLTPADSAGFEINPDFSPDGRQIAFERAVLGSSRAWVMSADGANPRRLSAAELTQRAPVFSPDGLSIAYTENRVPDPNDQTVVVAGADGSNPVDLTPALSGQQEVVGSFSATGREVLFNHGLGVSALLAVGRDGSGLRPLVPGEFSQGFNPSRESVFRCAGRRATIVGDDGPEKIKGTKKADVIVANGGNDTVLGRGGNDRICGGKGKDRLIGGAGKDRLIGGAGKDRLKGGPGKDKQKQ